MSNGETSPRLLMWWGNILVLVAAMVAGAAGAYWFWP